MMSKTQFLHLSSPSRTKVRNLTNDKGNAVAPKSRCLHVQGNNAVSPLGWCQLREIGTDMGEYFDAKEMSAARGSQPRPVPTGCVTAIISDAASRPPKVMIVDGPNKGEQTIMPIGNLASLGLGKDSEVFVKLLHDRKRLIKAEFKGKK